MAKKAKFKLPKRVAGVKIPKVIRKGPLGHFLNSSAGQRVLAEMLVAAAAAFTAVKADEDGAVGETLRHPVDSARRAGEAVAEAGSNESERLAHAFRAAGKAFRDSLREAAYLPWHELPVAGARAKKKSASHNSQDPH